MPGNISPPPITWTSPSITEAEHRRAICVHDWAHAGVRWWIDTTEYPVSWVRYVDQYFCRACLAVEGRPITYRQRLGDLPVKEGTFAADDELYGRLEDQARGEYRRRCEINPPAADPALDEAAAPAPRAD